jgi:hypothetical protein
MRSNSLPGHQGFGGRLHQRAWPIVPERVQLYRVTQRTFATNCNDQTRTATNRPDQETAAMKRRSTMMLLAAAVAAALAQPLAHAQSFSDLTRWVPQDANAVMALNVEKALDSDMGKDKFWRQVLQLNNKEGRTAVRPEFQSVVMAASVDMHEEVEADWQVFLARSTVLPATKDIAKRQGATLEQISGFDAMLSPRGSYVVRLGPETIGAYTPASRQRVRKTLDLTKEGSKLAANLSTSVSQFEASGATMLFALDLEGASSAANIAAHLKSDNSLKDTNVKPEELAALLATIKRVALRVNISDKAAAIVDIELGKPADMLGPVAAKVLDGALSSKGLQIEDVKDWTSKVNGNTVTLTGNLTGSSLGRLFSLFTPPRPSVPAAESKPAGDKNAVPDKAAATLAYYRSVDEYLKDVQRIRTAQDPTAAASFLTRYADKIEQLPILGVDPDLLTWTEKTVATLRQASGQLRQSRINSRRAMMEQANPWTIRDVSNNNANADNQGYYSGTDWSGVDYDMKWKKMQQETDRTKARILAETAGKEAAMGTLSSISSSWQVMRRTLTTKYNVEF